MILVNHAEKTDAEKKFFSCAVNISIGKIVRFTAACH